jgi:hypothetical protein
MHHIQKNLRSTLKIHIISQDIPDRITIIPIERIKNITITHMEEILCENNNCLSGKILYNNDIYKFIVHHTMYDVILIMEKSSYPFTKMKIILPITSYKDDRMDNKIYIPPEFSKDEKIIPIEFVWEFLSQLQPFLYQHQ